MKSAGPKVQYLKGNFDVLGIPESIAWKKNDGRVKKPADNGHNQIQEIMKNKDRVSFTIDERESQERPAAITGGANMFASPFSKIPQKFIREQSSLLLS